MHPWLEHPTVYEINAWTWLHALGRNGESISNESIFKPEAGLGVLIPLNRGADSLPICFRGVRDGIHMPAHGLSCVGYTLPPV
jgi:hypothetical protein